MKRLSTLLPLVVLAGLGWACAFAAVGLALFAGVPDNGPLALIFAAFGFAAGAVCTVMRLVVERQLPMDLASSLRRSPSTDELSARHEPHPSARPSAFGA